MIEFQNAGFFYRRRHPIFENLNLCIKTGERVCFSAPSGWGKTTLFRLILGLETLKSGKRICPADLRFSVVFQEDRLIEKKTVLQNVALFSDEETARKALRELGLEECADRLPEQLSGGQRRRVAIARAIGHPFDLLLLDEPFTGLDVAARQTAAEQILKAVGSKTLLLISHDPLDANLLQIDRTIP